MYKKSSIQGWGIQDGFKLKKLEHFFSKTIHPSVLVFGVTKELFMTNTNLATSCSYNEKFN